MASKVTPFFATHEDLIGVLRDAMAVRPIELVDAGLLDERTLVVISVPENLKSLRTYIVVERGDRMHMREAPQRRGGSKYKVNIADDFNCVALNTGGLCGENQLLPGQVGTLIANPLGLERYNLFAKTIRKRFEKIGPYYVGPEAVAMLDEGARLAQTAKSPREYDLTR
ncbi:hypothetical protein [Mitsuaria sp. 7]|uniref:hypothetical protein n=1 Tax=Mitsuaria sp. 7 TaxID=1658665 RepID=UPI0007DCC924|nr:hypothetical protein [Mitsuaria sp. 7]ANH67489.1 hypothetical protein ABE85_07750 [Mitsuaria sp. 7]